MNSRQPELITPARRQTTRPWNNNWNNWSKFSRSIRDCSIFRAENDEYRKRLKDPAPSSSVSAIADNPSTSRRSNMATSSNKKPNKPVSTRMRSKPPVVETPETEGLEEPSPPHPAEKPSRKRKKPKNEPATTTEEEPEREQGERRKSKRLSGARSKTLSVYSAYSWIVSTYLSNNHYQFKCKLFKREKEDQRSWFIYSLFIFAANYPRASHRIK